MPVTCHDLPRACAAIELPECSKADERRALLRVIEGGKGNGAPAMWQRLYELHAKEEARSIAEAERQEMQGIEAIIDAQPINTPAPDARRTCHS